MVFMGMTSMTALPAGIIVHRSRNSNRSPGAKGVAESAAAPQMDKGPTPRPMARTHTMAHGIQTFVFFPIAHGIYHES
jgi:hypothetical protein